MSEVIMVTITGSESGKVPDKQVPFCRYKINDQKHYAIYGIDFDVYPVEAGVSVMPDGKIINAVLLGKLNEMEPYHKLPLFNSLLRDGWDFENYPNPEILGIEEIS